MKFSRFKWHKRLFQKAKPFPSNSTSAQIARFMLCDRDADAFSRPTTEEAFQAYVHAHFWDEPHGRGGWECATLFCCVRRNALYAQQP